MKFYLRIYDNFHAGDETVAYNSGAYETFEHARACARSIVAEFLKEHYKPGMKTRYLCMLYGMYGAEPHIFSDEKGEMEKFSALDYAKELAFEICTRENE